MLQAAITWIVTTANGTGVGCMNRHDVGFRPLDPRATGGTAGAKCMQLGAKALPQL